MHSDKKFLLLFLVIALVILIFYQNSNNSNNQVNRTNENRRLRRERFTNDANVPMSYKQDNFDEYKVNVNNVNANKVDANKVDVGVLDNLIDDINYTNNLVVNSENGTASEIADYESHSNSINKAPSYRNVSYKSSGYRNANFGKNENMPDNLSELDQFFRRYKCI